MLAVPNFSRLTPLDRDLGDVGDLLRTPGVNNVNLNVDSVWVEQAGHGKYRAPFTLTEDERKLLICRIATDTGKGPITDMNSRMSFDLPKPYSVRGHSFCNPVGPGWIAMFRNHQVNVMDDRQIKYKREKASNIAPLASETYIDGVCAAVLRRMNILVVGPQNSGKTTHLDWLLSKFSQARENARLIVMQDNSELQVKQLDHVQLFAGVKQQKFARNGTSVEYTYEFADLIPDVLRCSADAYVLGEMRSPDAVLGWVLAANNGARGMMTTIHANSALEGLYRVEQLIATARDVHFTQSPREIVAASVDAIIYLEYDENTRERWVGDFQWREGIKDGEYVLRDVVQ